MVQKSNNKYKNKPPRGNKDAKPNPAKMMRAGQPEAEGAPSSAAPPSDPSSICQHPQQSEGLGEDRDRFDTPPSGPEAYQEPHQSESSHEGIIPPSGPETC